MTRNFESQHEDTFTFSEADSQCETSQLREQLRHNLCSLFLKITVLHVTNIATQEIVDHMTEIFSLSQPLIKDSIKEILHKHHISPTETMLDDFLNSFRDCNIFTSSTAKGQELSSRKRRETYVEKNFPVV